MQKSNRAAHARCSAELILVTNSSPSGGSKSGKKVKLKKAATLNKYNLGARLSDCVSLLLLLITLNNKGGALFLTRSCYQRHSHHVIKANCTFAAVQLDERR